MNPFDMMKQYAANRPLQQGTPYGNTQRAGRLDRMRQAPNVRMQPGGQMGITDGSQRFLGPSQVGKAQQYAMNTAAAGNWVSQMKPYEAVPGMKDYMNQYYAQNGGAGMFAGGGPQGFGDWNNRFKSAGDWYNQMAKGVTDEGMKGRLNDYFQQNLGRWMQGNAGGIGAWGDRFRAANGYISGQMGGGMPTQDAIDNYMRWGTIPTGG